MSAQLGLVMVLVPDTSRAKEFYTELLGYKFIEGLSSPDGDFLFLHSETGGPNLALQDANKQNYGVPAEHGGIILGYMVEDADAVYRDWQSKSVEILGEVFDMGAGRMFTAKDPAGNYIQVYHLYPQVLEMQKQMGLL
jgi:predicted enzyme related to lactoylglutathione lyase